MLFIQFTYDFIQNNRKKICIIINLKSRAVCLVVLNTKRVRDLKIQIF